ncbi:50S ribosomal protein L15 [Patescibacteria group bacterium]|nr:MAG: 50S ribosomal protein L15 [Patescibacteria group bacterium]
MMHTLHSLHPAKGSTKRKKRVGRGNASGHGTYSTRGMKGQKARSGGRKGLKRLGMKRIVQAMPKLGGFRSRAVPPVEVRLTVIDRAYAAGETVSLKTLKKKGLIPYNARASKMLAPGKLTKKLTFNADIRFTGSARAAAEAGGATFAAAADKAKAKTKAKN